MKNLKVLFLASITISAFVLNGESIRAGEHETIDPFKTCGVGSTKDIVAIDQLWDA